MAKAEQQDRRAAMARRSARLLRVLVAGGVALATACAGVQKGGQGSSSDPAGPPSQPRSGGGASGW